MALEDEELASKVFPKELIQNHFVQDPPECHNKTVAVLKEIPEESCDIIPSKICRLLECILLSVNSK